VTLAETKAPRGGAVVTVNIAPELPMIHGDQHQLTQVFTNLLANAFEALDGKGHITITAARSVADEDPLFASGQPPVPMVVVDVADDGPGVPPDLADRIFDPFFTTKPQGSGLGLAIVSKIVDAHDGRIDVTTSGAGTRFRVTLPISTAGGWFK
jgi:signal transduction histidine kinase